MRIPDADEIKLSKIIVVFLDLFLIFFLLFSLQLTANKGAYTIASFGIWTLPTYVTASAATQFAFLSSKS